MPEADLLGLAGKVAVVTGGSRGIGLATARLLAAQGTHLAILGRTESEALLRARDELGESVTVLATACDAAEPAQVSAAYRQVRSTFGRVDVLVNNAGVMEDAPLGMITTELIHRVLAVNTVSTVLHTQAAARLMRKAGSGSIVNLTSIIGRVGSAGQVVYGASKAAVIGMTASAAKELAPQRIRVNAVAPGFIATDMTARLNEVQSREAAASVKMGRIGTPEDVARVILFLASDLAEYVTGQVLGVDGGMLI